MTPNITKNMPYLVVSDAQGNVFETPEYKMVGMRLKQRILPAKDELINLPDGSDLFVLPGRIPVGYDPQLQAFVEVPEYKGQAVFAVSGFMAPAYVQFYRSAYQTLPGAQRLSLYNYTSIGWQRNGFVVAGGRIDPDQRQELKGFDQREIDRQRRQMAKRYPHNRLVHHLLDNCVDRYCCPAARNFSLGRFECPIPTSPGCNAVCIGCISEQPQETHVKSSQDRITFVPTVEEIVEFTVPHLETAPRPVVSFGQGCEGEPLLAGDVIEAAIREIRRRTPRGIINLNTNASRPQIVERLCEAGLDSIRVSMNSAQKHYYHAYYRPRNYAFEHVLETMRIMRRFKRWVSINYFIFPGFTDQPAETAALKAVVQDVKLNMIQTRNLNIDPEWYMDELKLHDLAESSPQGIRSWIAEIRSTFPWLKLGYFNPPQEEMKPEHFAFS